MRTENTTPNIRRPFCTLASSALLAFTAMNQTREDNSRDSSQKKALKHTHILVIFMMEYVSKMHWITHFTVSFLAVGAYLWSLCSHQQQVTEIYKRCDVGCHACTCRERSTGSVILLTRTSEAQDGFKTRSSAEIYRFNLAREDSENRSVHEKISTSSDGCGGLFVNVKACYMMKTPWEEPDSEN